MTAAQPSEAPSGPSGPPQTWNFIMGTPTPGSYIQMPGEQQGVAGSGANSILYPEPHSFDLNKRKPG